MMIDWSEGHHELQTLVKALYEAALDDRQEQAEEICTQIVAVARMTRAQLKAQRPTPES
jgi:hypothetical protein